jgi:DNA repair protein SbcC/Rad50
MQIQSVKLENIRSYVSETISFDSGATLLSGDIGCGKSTILLAIEFALFGLKKGELSGAGLLRKGANEGAVELKFKIEEKSYHVKRTLKKNSNSIGQGSGYIIENGLKQELTPVELKTKIISLLGYPKELVTKSASLIYRYTVYTPQEQMKYILFENAEERLNTLRKVFDIDKYKRINENASVYVKRLKDECKELMGFVLDLNQKHQQWNEKNKEIESKESELLTSVEELKQISVEVLDTKSQIKNLEEKIEELNRVKKQIEIIQNTIEKDEERIDKIQSANSILRNSIEELNTKKDGILVKVFEKEDSELTNEIEKLELEKKQMFEQKSLFEQTCKANETQLENISEQILRISNKLKDCDMKKNKLFGIKTQIQSLEGLEQRQKELDSEVQEIQRKISLYKHQTQENKDKIEKIETLDECPTCLQEVRVDHKLKIKRGCENNIEQHQKKLKEYNTILEGKIAGLEKIKQRQEEQNVLKQKSHILEGEISNFETLQKDLQELKGKQEILKEKRQELGVEKEWDLEKFEIQIKEKKLLLEQIRQNEIKRKEKEHITSLLQEKMTLISNNDKEFQEKTKSLVEFRLNKETLKQKLLENTNTLDSFRIIKTKLDTQLLKEKELFGKKVGIEKEISTLRRITEMLRSEIEKKEVSKKTIEQKNQLINWLNEYFVNLVNTIEKQVMIKIHRQFNELFMQWFSLMTDHLTAELDETFTPKVQQNEHDIEIENLSGGEKTALALAYRLSLNKVINDIVTDIKTKDLIILDEPTDGFSSEQLDRVRDVLEQLNLNQMIVVSHENKVESFVDKVLRVNKEEHISKVS